MSQDLSPQQMQAIAKHMSEMGRNGDSQLIPVMPEEIEFLEKIGGAGTVNPQTGLKEFNTTQDKINAALKESGGQWTSEINDLAKQRDADKGQVYNSSTKTYTSTSSGNSNSSSNNSSSNSSNNDTGSNTIRQSFANLLTPGDGMVYENGVLVNSSGQRINNNTSWQDAANLSTPNDGKQYVNGQLVNDDNQPVNGNHENIFSTALNVVGLVANPAAFIASKVIGGVANSFMDGISNPSGAGQSSNTPYVHPTNNDDDNRRSSSASDTSTTTEADTTSDSDTDTTASEATELSTEFGYSTTSNFSPRLNGTSLIEYDYTDGTGQKVGTYNGNEKPFHITTSAENSRAYAMTEQGSNMIEQLVSQLPRDIMEQLQGNISMFTTADNKVALVAGDQQTGLVEATYDATKEGYTNAMNDVGAMLEYARVENDTNIDAGYMGRVSSYQKYKGYETPGLQIEKSRLMIELQNYDQGSPQYNSAMASLASLDREIQRRTRDGNEVTTAYSVDGVTEQISQSIRDQVA